MNIVPLNYKGEIVSFNTDGWMILPSNSGHAAK